MRQLTIRDILLQDSGRYIQQFIKKHPEQFKDPLLMFRDSTMRGIGYNRVHYGWVRNGHMDQVKKRNKEVIASLVYEGCSIYPE